MKEEEKSCQNPKLPELAELIRDLKHRNQHFYQCNCAGEEHITGDGEIILRRMEKLSQIPEMRVGDFLQMRDGKVTRVAHNWGDQVQPTPGQAVWRGGDSSFYLGDGFVDYSGSLEPGISVERFRLTEETKMGMIWIFHRDRMQAGWGVVAMVPFRVYALVEEGDRKEAAADGK